MPRRSCNNVGGVRVVHFVVCSTFCLQKLSPAYKMVWPQTRLQNGFLQPTKWYGHKLGPTKWCSCQLSWTFVSKNDFDMFIQKWSGRTFAFMLQKNPGPFCRASTLSGTQLQGQFSIAILPCHSFLFKFHPKLIKHVLQFARGQTVQDSSHGWWWRTGTGQVLLSKTYSASGQRETSLIVFSK